MEITRDKNGYIKLDAGDFSVSVDVMTVKNGRKLAPRVVKMLTDNWGYVAEYKVVDSYRCEERIDISWEESDIK